MYCRYCGKELPNESNFCPSCGAKQIDKSKKGLDISFYIMSYIKEHKKFFYVLFVWVLLHITLFVSSEKNDRCDDQFYPFDMPFSDVIQGGRQWYYDYGVITPNVEFLGSSINYYDFTEFFAYVIILPLFIWGIVRFVPYIKSEYKKWENRYNQWQVMNANKRGGKKVNDVANKIQPKEEPLSNSDQINTVVEDIAISERKGCNVVRDTTLSGEKSSDTVVLQQESQPKEEHNQDEVNLTETDAEVKKMPLFKRFIGSIIDKFLIILIFVVGTTVVSFHGSGERLGNYLGLFNTPVYLYEYIDQSKMNNYGTYHEGISKGYQDLARLEIGPPHIGSTLELDKNMTFAFIVLNIVFYIIFESIFCASPGKRMLGGIIIDGVGDKIDVEKAAVRGLSCGAMMGGLYCLIHLLFGFSNSIVVFMFFLLLDLPVLFTKKSLLDLLTGTKYVKRNTIQL